MSEVLIALVVIGIVAALTLPIIMANIEEKQMKAALKKNYTVLKSALERYYVDNGEWLVPVANDALRANLKSTLAKYLTVMTDCGYGSNEPSACISNFGIGSERNTKVYKNYSGKTDLQLQYFDDGQFVLNDGTFVLIENATAAARVWISVDVNGYGKKPNRLGRDLFMFQLMNDGQLLPMGAPGTHYQPNFYCTETGTDSMNGAGCTYKFLNER